VAAPRRVVLHKHIFISIANDSVEVSTDENGDITLFSWLSFRLEVGCESTTLVIVDEVLDGVDRELVDGAGVDVLLHIFTGGEESDSGGVSLGNTNEFGETVLDAVFGAGDNEEDLTIEVFSSFFVYSVVGAFIVVREEDESVIALAEDGLDVVFGKVDKHRYGGSVQPVGQACSIQSTSEVNR